MSLHALTVNNVIVDDCFEPLLQKYYEQQFKEDDFDLLGRELMEASSARKHEAMVGIYRLFLANRGLLPKMVASGLLFKLIFFLREEQFPQLCFQALRIIFFTVDYGRIAEHMINSGGVYSLLNLVKRDNNKALIGLSLWSLAKIANHASGDKVAPRVGINDFLEIVENPDRENEANAIITHLIVQIWRNNVLLRPEDVDRFHSIVLTEIIKVNVSDENLLVNCFKLLNQRTEYLAMAVSAGHWKLLKQVLQNLQNRPNEILKHYLKFLLRILIIDQKIVLKQLLIKLDALKIFQSLLDDPEQQTRFQFCSLTDQILGVRSLPCLKYFLSKQSILIKFYYLIESDTITIKKAICVIFSSLSMFPCEDVLLLYEEAKIVAVYLRLLRQHEEVEFKKVCLHCLISVLSFARKMSLTTFNWFINYLKTQKCEETLQNIGKQTRSKQIKKFIAQLQEFFVEKVVET